MGIDLLRLEMETLWERDAYGRLRPHPLVAVAVADDGRAVRFGPEVPDELRRTLVAGALNVSSPLERVRAWGAIHGGPSYVFPESVSPGSSDLTILTSDGAVPPMLAAARPEAWWESEEWDDLLAGRLGPWAIGMDECRVAALCHTPVGSLVAAEAGVWTHPDERGQGYAVAMTAAWAKVARRRFGTLFYSTGDDNAASQAVARKLGLVPIGRIWQLREAADNPENG